MINFGYNIGDIVCAKKDYIEYKYNKNNRTQTPVGKYFSAGDKFKVTRIDIADNLYIESDRIWLFHPDKYHDPIRKGNMGFCIEEFSEYFLTFSENRDKRINEILND